MDEGDIEINIELLNNAQIEKQEINSARNLSLKELFF